MNQARHDQDSAEQAARRAKRAADDAGSEIFDAVSDLTPGGDSREDRSGGADDPAPGMAAGPDS
jgi:hypothetical protein